MICLNNRDAVLRALNDCDLDPSLRALIASRRGRMKMTARSEDFEVVAVEGGDTPEVINEAVGFAITGEHAEEPSFDWIKDHGRWFEIAYLREGSPDLFVMVENTPATELGIHHMCLAHFWPDDDAGIGR